ncbi:MAG: hypothetical protein M1819_002015 [Sarea resinae]|nr:MAG: hypothetical protein M1819_002015 [Sarea resinae]
MASKIPRLICHHGPVLNLRLSSRTPSSSRLTCTLSFTRTTSTARALIPPPRSALSTAPSRPTTTTTRSPSTLALTIRPSTTATSAISTPSPANLPPYQPPTTGLLSHLPAPLVPYAELARLDKPTGTYYLLFPCIFSTLLAAPLTTPITPPSTLLSTILLFATGSLIMRSAGCTINDLWDRRLDPLVTRTAHRPLARGAISPQNAVLFTGAQLLAGLTLLLQFPLPSTFYWATPSLALVTLYPLAKRYTHYPQFILGLTFSWGALLGFPALHLDPLASPTLLAAAACLYASNVAWTVLYDAIYAHMDAADDARAGIKSIALAHRHDTKPLLCGLAAAQLACLSAAGVAVGAGPAFFVLGVGGAGVTLANMIWRVRLHEVRDCWWWFRWGAWFTGGAVTVGLGAEWAVRYWGLGEMEREGGEEGQKEMRGDMLVERNGEGRK